MNLFYRKNNLDTYLVLKASLADQWMGRTKRVVLATQGHRTENYLLMPFIDLDSLSE
jgi:hypothetical protein